MAEIRSPKAFNHLTAISSIDGRFRGRTEKIANYFSEDAVIRGRASVEIEYLIAFLKQIGKRLKNAEVEKLRRIVFNFGDKEVMAAWEKDLEIDHDAKAVEYVLAGKLREIGLANLVNFLHLGLTTMDIDYTALAISLKNFTDEVYIPTVQNLIKAITKLALENKNLVMLGRTHGQVAVPTTAGKEMANFAYRLKVQLEKLHQIKIGAKVTGAIGNYNALVAAYPQINWPAFSKKFLQGFGLESYPMTTQIEPLDHKIEYIQAVKRINFIVEAIDGDLWRYLALGYLTLRGEEGQVGSSTMPQKINPIGLELSENYTTLANGIFEVMERRFPTNRWQRDLTDKYLMRDFGQAMAMSVLSYEATTESLAKLGFNKGLISTELDNHWECIAEGIQTILRTTDCVEPYEKLKELTRGKKVTKADYEKFIEEIDVPKKIKEKLRKLSPQNYVGLARQLSEVES